MAEKRMPVRLTWLGQAGFLIESGSGADAVRVVVDPYLSDSLYEKYREKKFTHKRMVPPPLKPEELTGIDFVLCTHGHTDHMDPGSLPGLAEANPACSFICPASERAKALERGVPDERFVGLDAGKVFSGSFERAAGAVLRVSAVASAHEQLAEDSEGRSLYLGYVIDINGVKLYHSGDCIPYDGLEFHIAKQNVDIALLPVNGRDEYRKSNGVPGNFTVNEAVQLCLAAGVKTLVPHHFGMFDFNTEPPEIIEKVLSESGLNYYMPEVGRILYIL